MPRSSPRLLVSVAALPALLGSALAPAQCAPAWSSLGGSPGPHGPAYAVVRLANGDVIAGGGFATVGTTPMNHIARWNGTTWSPLGTGVNDYVYALTVLANGDVIAGGAFTLAGGVNVGGIARWNGAAWSSLAYGFQVFAVESLGRMPNGDLVAGVGNGSVQHWDGVSWQQIGSFNGHATGFAVRNGELIVAGKTYMGVFHNAAALGRWNGGTWTVSTVGAVDTEFTAVTALPNGDLVFGGHFATLGGVALNNVARWNGSTFAPLGAGLGGAADYVQSLAVLADDSVVAGGFGGGGAARWDGTAWSPLGVGVNGGVLAWAVAPDGAYASGDFSTAGGAAADNTAKWSTPCVPSVVAYGSGCTGPAGPNVLSATSGPWTGGTFRATGTGMPASALVGSVYGFTTESTPLAAALPGALPGCLLLVHPDLTSVLLPVGGVATSQLAIPNAPSAAGFVLYHQLVALELTGVLQFGAITSSNALAVTVGSL
ncbi:MAG: hypothetical protein QM775_25035 [Pirellulales bacterium]